MRRKHILERASVLNKSSAKVGVPFVLALAAPELKHVHTAGYMCTSCGSEFASQEGTEPFCVNCGSEAVESKALTVAKLPENDSTLAALHCKSCGTHNVLSDVTAGVLNGHMHCVECGTSLTYDTEGLDRPITDADSADINNTVTSNSGPDDLAGGAPTDVTITDAPAGDIPATLKTTVADTVTADEPVTPITPATPGAAPVAPVDPMDPVEPVTVETAEQTQQLQQDQQDQQQAPLVDDLQDDELVQASEQDEEDDEDDEQVESFVKTSLVAAVLAANAKPAFSLVTSDNEVLAFADGVCVARMTMEDAGEFAAVMHTASFAQSIETVAQREGVRAALAAYPFKPIVVAFPQKLAVRAMVERKAVEASAAYADKTESHANEFLQCVSLASTGLTKGFFRQHENALKRGFMDMLTTAGVKNPGKIVDSVFASNADTYHRTLFTLAGELMSKPVDVRNELANTLGQANMVVSEDQSDQDDDEDQDDDQEQANLAYRAEHSAVRPSRQSRQRVQSNVEANTSIQSIRQAAGGKLF